MKMTSVHIKNCLIVLVLLHFFASCNSNILSSNKRIDSPIGTKDQTPTPTVTPTVTPSGSPTATPSPTPSPTSSGSDQHQYGVPKKSSSVDKAKLIPITFIFLNSSTQKLSPNPQADAARAITLMNEKFKLNGTGYVQFTLKEAREVLDNTYFTTDCNLLGSVAQKYGTGKSMVMVLVNELAGPCAGVSYLWKFPREMNAVTMAEYKDPFINGVWTPVVHEFAHSFGLHHTGNEYPGSVPKTGLYLFSSLLGNTSRSCSVPFKYFIDPKARDNSAVADGVTWASYYNTMYPSYGGKPDNGFFTSGYDYAMSWAFDCWYGFAKNDF